ncbi:undecaprenyldiphospho-muramoylpentapeptide beta-N-acetylglucosaminyltransferase [candidate division LCP-89 bacterium B3_LCP]|uniref:UDP-N-acetylglucosamine--N-acetylmuramyl-(pentapeptide) pyrophosphoryl-undecaprenol N-acetylglucosamine transferase n=1 Tax=candidate division LCP-89 bacterium B3_LCP TaxID=2012998 RepID=A0A532V2W9_UNCL8|nr:MAG: undecaprenyldiphospho-muramoylpentapeptide beta-N-acetylglucosaminyltransferase [candidate division LCP-89 bacterium B3_LCP]
MSSPRVLIVGGGTGGHLFPALAVADKLSEKGAQIIFAGTRAGIEAKLVPARGYSLKFLWLSGFKRNRIISNLLLPLKVLISLVQSLAIIWKFQPQAALGTGGYTCGPLLLIASLYRIPVFLQEQNSFPGVTTRMLARFARRVFLNFPEASEFLPKRTRWSQSGNPVRADIDQISREDALSKWGLDPSLPILLVFGGSQGAASINRAVNECLEELSAMCNLIWGHGSRDQKEVDSWTGKGKLIEKSFIEDMPSAYAAADLAICRSGAMTLSELQVANVPALLIPYPYAAGDHQMHNAIAYSKKGGAVVIPDAELNGTKLIAEVKNLLNNPEELKNMRSALSGIQSINASEMIAEEIIDSISEKVKS